MKTGTRKALGSLLLAVMLCVANTAVATRVGVFCYMNGPGDNGDDNIRINIRTTPQGEALIEVENLTDRIVYVDRRSSFAFVDGRSVPLHIPSSNTESHTIGRGVVYDDDYTDIKWVDGESHTSSLTVYDQPVQAIAPHGVSIAYVWHDLPRLLRPDMIDIGRVGGCFSYNCKGRFMDTGRRFTKGDSRQYTEHDTPLSLRALVSYSVDSPHGTLSQIDCSDYVSRITVGSDDSVTREALLRTPYRGNCFCFRSGKSVGAVIGEWAAVAAVVGIYAAFRADVKSMENSMPDLGF